MCGRFALFASEDEIVDHFSLKAGFMMRARYNIAPSQIIPIVLENAKQIDFSYWGFVPTWAKSEDETPKGYMNARLETIMEKPAFKMAFLRRRCLIPVSGYYEWAIVGKKKQAFYFQDKSKSIMAFAGIWSVWQGKQTTLHSCAILTKPAQDEIKKIHDRMPVIVPQREYKLYLSAYTDPLEIQHRIASFCAPLDFYPVSSLINNAKSEGKECITQI